LGLNNTCTELELGRWMEVWKEEQYGVRIASRDMDMDMILQSAPRLKNKPEARGTNPLSYQTSAFPVLSYICIFVIMLAEHQQPGRPFRTQWLGLFYRSTGWLSSGNFEAGLMPITLLVISTAQHRTGLWCGAVPASCLLLPACCFLLVQCFAKVRDIV